MSDEDFTHGMIIAKPAESEGKIFIGHDDGAGNINAGWPLAMIDFGPKFSDRYNEARLAFAKKLCNGVNTGKSQWDLEDRICDQRARILRQTEFIRGRDDVNRELKARVKELESVLISTKKSLHVFRFTWGKPVIQKIDNALTG